MPEGYSNINYESFSNVENSNVENFNEELDTLAILVLQNTDDGYIQNQYNNYSNTLKEYKEDGTINNTDYNTLQRLLSNVESSKNTLLNSLLASAKLVKLQRVKDSLGLKARNLMTSYLNMHNMYNMKCETNTDECRLAKTNLETKLGETLEKSGELSQDVNDAIKEYKEYAKDNQKTIKGYVDATVQHNQNENLFIAAFAKAIGNMNNEIRKQVEDACMIEAQRRYDTDHKVEINTDDFTCKLSGRNYEIVETGTGGNTNEVDTTITTTTTTTTTNTYDDDMAPPTPSGETTKTGRVIGGLFAGIIILGIFFLAINCFFGFDWVSCAWLAILGSGSDSKPRSTTTTTTTTITTRGSAPAPTRVLGSVETSEFDPAGLDKISSTGLTTSDFN